MSFDAFSKRFFLLHFEFHEIISYLILYVFNPWPLRLLIRFLCGARMLYCD